MTLVYFDSSAFVKLIAEEEGSDLAAQLWDGCDAAVSSRLAYPEVRAALATAQRNRQMRGQDVEMAERDWEEFWAATRPVELTHSVERHAGHLARAYSLQGADAVHLASALAIEPSEVVVAAWDRRLRAGAATSGLPVAPAPTRK